MEARAVLRFVRIAPRKTRLVIDLIRGKNVQESVAILTHLPRSAAKVVKNFFILQLQTQSRRI